MPSCAKILLCLLTISLTGCGWFSSSPPPSQVGPHNTPCGCPGTDKKNQEKIIPPHIGRYYYGARELGLLPFDRGTGQLADGVTPVDIGGQIFTLGSYRVKDHKTTSPKPTKDHRTFYIVGRHALDISGEFNLPFVNLEIAGAYVRIPGQSKLKTPVLTVGLPIFQTVFLEGMEKKSYTQDEWLRAAASLRVDGFVQTSHFTLGKNSFVDISDGGSLVIDADVNHDEYMVPGSLIIGQNAPYDRSKKKHIEQHDDQSSAPPEPAPPAQMPPFPPGLKPGMLPGQNMPSFPGGGPPMPGSLPTGGGAPAPSAGGGLPPGPAAPSSGGVNQPPTATAPGAPPPAQPGFNGQRGPGGPMIISRLGDVADFVDVLDIKGGRRPKKGRKGRGRRPGASAAWSYPLAPVQMDDIDRSVMGNFHMPLDHPGDPMVYRENPLRRQGYPNPAPGYMSPLTYTGCALYGTIRARNVVLKQGNRLDFSLGPVTFDLRDGMKNMLGLIAIGGTTDVLIKGNYASLQSLHDPAHRNHLLINLFSTSAGIQATKITITGTALLASHDLAINTTLPTDSAGQLQLPAGIDTMQFEILSAHQLLGRLSLVTAGEVVRHLPTLSVPRDLPTLLAAMGKKIAIQHDYNQHKIFIKIVDRSVATDHFGCLPDIGHCDQTVYERALVSAADDMHLYHW